MLALILGVVPVSWEALATGLELGYLKAEIKPAIGDSTVVILRIDPQLWTLEFAGVTQTGESKAKTAREWSEDRGFTAATNAGMFAADHRTHVGYLRSGDHVNSAGVTKYKSVAAYGPREGQDLPLFRVFDLDSPGVTVDSIAGDYRLVVQNLRLIRRPGINVWSRQENRWSEAALGEDSEGRLLFIFTRSAYSMRDLNRILLGSDLVIVAAQHLEGGPEAQLYVRVGDIELELFGSYETGFMGNEGNTTAWPVPNVLGIRPRPAGPR